MKLKYKTFFLFSVIAILPLVLFTSFSFMQYIRVTDRRMAEISHEQQESIADQVADSFDSVKQVLTLLTWPGNGEYSVISTLRPYVSEQRVLEDYEIYRASQNIKYLAENLFYMHDYLNSVHIFTPSRSMIAYITKRNGWIPQHYDPIDDAWYQETLARNGQLYISELANHPMFESDQESIFFAQSIIDTDTQSYLGVLILDCSPKLFNLDSANILGDQNLITLTNSENGSVYYTNCSEDAPAAKDSTTSAVLPIEGTPLTLSIVSDYSSLRSEYSHVTMMLLFFSAGCILCILLLSFYISSSLIRPVQQLSDEMLHQRTAHLTPSSNYTDRKDEIGTLYRQYYAMIDELNRTIREEYQNKLIMLDAQMKSLEARINSHFLFNTLESINSMAELSDQEEISTMSLALGNMFRYAIKTEGNLVTLRQELGHVSDYVAIQSIRFNGRFRLETAISDELADQKILKLLLQPLVENALQHGLDYCTRGDTIRIDARLVRSNLCLTVSDNGAGIPPERLEALRQMLRGETSVSQLGVHNKHSIGLRNIQSRIELYYGKSYGLSIDSTEGAGSAVTICLPVLSERPADTPPQTVLPGSQGETAAGPPHSHAGGISHNG